MQIYIQINRILSVFHRNVDSINPELKFRALRLAFNYNMFNYISLGNKNTRTANQQLTRLFKRCYCTIEINKKVKKFYATKKKIIDAMINYHNRQTISYTFVDSYWKSVIEIYRANLQRYKSLPFAVTLYCFN
jgi:hypothetical protein